MAGLNVPMIFGMIVSMIFEAMQGEEIELTFDRRILTLGLGIRLTCHSGGEVFVVDRAIDARKFAGDMEAKVATGIVVDVLQEMHRKVKPVLNKKVDGKDVIEA